MKAFLRFLQVKPTTPTRRGAIAILSAFMLVIVVGFLAFSVDFGYVIVTESQLQNAADAAALSAARALPSGRAAAVTAAQSWATKKILPAEFR